MTAECLLVVQYQLIMPGVVIAAVTVPVVTNLCRLLPSHNAHYHQEVGSISSHLPSLSVTNGERCECPTLKVNPFSTISRSQWVDCGSDVVDVTWAPQHFLRLSLFEACSRRRAVDRSAQRDSSDPTLSFQASRDRSPADSRCYCESLVRSIC
ncbi:hypothetical protein J6590_008039 [Homalodisca vitripennis]|nr:hypothetical protein J6590_008039 [Homalodisca vitripennis]